MLNNALKVSMKKIESTLEIAPAGLKNKKPRFQEIIRVYDLEKTNVKIMLKETYDLDLDSDNPSMAKVITELHANLFGV